MAKTTKTQKATLAMALLTAFIPPFASSALNLSVVNIEADLNANAALVGWIVTAFTLTVVACSVPLGKIADSRGRKRMLIVGTAGMAIVSFAGIFSVSMGMLIGIRVLQGICGGMLFATNLPLLVAAYPPEKRGQMLGISSCSTYCGLSLGPVLGGILNNSVGWRSIFVVLCAVAVAALIVTIPGVKDDRVENPSKGHADIPGVIVYVLFAVMFLYGLTDFTVMKAAKAMIVGGIVLAFVFVLIERRSPNPTIRISLFTKDRVFTCGNLAAMLNYASTFAVTYLLSIYLQVVKGYSTQIAGVMLIFMPVVQAVFSPFMGRLSDRIAPYKLACSGMAVGAAGLLCLVFLREGTPVWLLMVVLSILGLGFALFSAPNMNEVMSRVGPDDLSIANSVLSTMRTAGQTVSMAVVTIIVGILMNGQTLNDAEPAVLTSTMRFCFLVFMIMCIIGLFLSISRANSGQTERSF